MGHELKKSLVIFLAHLANLYGDAESFLKHPDNISLQSCNGLDGAVIDGLCKAALCVVLEVLQ